MKKTITLLLCGLGLQAQAATLVWNADTTKQASITDSASWASNQTPGSGDSLQFNGTGNVLINSELTVNDINFNTGGTTYNLTLDFAAAGKLTSTANMNFSGGWWEKENASITFAATLAPQETGVMGSRTLLDSQGNWGIWNFIDVIEKGSPDKQITGTFAGYKYLGILRESEWDKLSAGMEDGTVYLVYTGADDASDNNLEVRWKGGAAVPEPTTSTLSLLALAGLCLRRRRCA